MTLAAHPAMPYAAAMSSRPTALILTAAGINCDHELVEAFELAGAEAVPVHLTRLIREPDMIDDFDLIGLPGGFSYGDAIAAGRILATMLNGHIIDHLRAAIDRGVPMIAPCNGFQIAVQAGLLPGPWTDAPARTEAALLENDGGRFVDRWVRVEYPQSRCVWTQGLQSAGAAAMLPIAHGEGRFHASDETMRQLEDDGRIAVRYAVDDDPNGSRGRVAGICDHTGLVFGLMPHPERYVSWKQHPMWTRLDEQRGDTPGLQMFHAAVAHVQTAGVTAP
ncbi:MAG: phosphoribosylformylglycinamidine synthase [Planctomycetaceae bacterium]|nr:phosphoribosylformylglycinamidine synthase [Planctomycetaceae bacterium]HCA39309.1 phosphoribosylformylglycinamidine synthase [Phycisphaerales bacterium]|tara:strand:- start:4804 stop:5637 length:834 start_codon:yes stop_codon:yes gene_type:complete